MRVKVLIHADRQHTAILSLRNCEKKSQFSHFSLTL